MRILRTGFLVLILLLGLESMRGAYSYAQQGAGTNSAAGVTCPVDGSSIQVLALNTRRISYSILNQSDTDVRIGFLDTGTADLTDSNSIILKPGQPLADSIPGVYYGRIVCMSTSASTKIIYATEAQR